MKISPTGAALIQSFEECRLTVYLDLRGIRTIGWGHTGPDVVPGLVWTQEQADSHFLLDIATTEAAVSHSVTVALSQNQFDALCSLCFNIGSGNFHSSTLVKDINSGNALDEQRALKEWDHISGRQNAGLDRRRAAEWSLFCEQ
jgi:lysozyme